MPPKPAQVVKKADAIVDKLEGQPKNIEEFNKYLKQMKVILFGSGAEEPSSEIVAQLSNEVYNTGLLFKLCVNMKHMDFEGKKDVVQIFNKLLRREISNRMPTVDHIAQNKPEILTQLCYGYKDSSIALSTGMMLRECIKQESLAKIILYSDELFDEFFDYVQNSQFDVAADAFSTFRDLLTKNKIICSKFLEEKFDKIFSKYDQLLNSENYVTRRQSLKLLGELLLDRTNFTVMTRYISNPENLKLMMNMLRDSSRNIQFEAFHVFKVFVANPDKPAAIHSILSKNKEKLVKFLKDFHNDRAEDEQFTDEKEFVIKQINELK